MSTHDLTHARHDPIHCLAPGLFRSLQKGERKRAKLDVVYDFGDGSPPTLPLTRHWLDGILLWEAYGRCRDRCPYSHQREEPAMLGDSANDLFELPRRSLPPIKIWVTLEERAEIEIRAAQTGLSVSAYMRAAGLNHPVRSVLDLKAVADLVRINGDLGRVAGLLKLWLAEKRGQGASPVDVEALMKDLWALQTEMRQIMWRAVRGR